MYTIKTHFNGWGVFHPDWCGGHVPVFGGAGTEIWDCLRFKRELENQYLVIVRASVKLVILMEWC